MLSNEWVHTIHRSIVSRYTLVHIIKHAVSLSNDTSFLSNVLHLLQYVYYSYNEQ